MLLQVKWSISLDISHVHLRFLDLVDVLLLHLSAADKLLYNLTEECQKLMASSMHEVSLFNEQFLKKLNNVSSYFMLKLILLPFMSWLDHSVLWQLVLASKNEVAMRLLKQFNSLIDYTRPFISYPIPAPSQLMIPLDDSDYTLMTTKCDCNLEEVSLQRIADMKALLISKLEITDHAMQLMAVHINQKTLYWMIPKCILSNLKDKLNYDSIQYNLRKGGIIMSTVFPVRFHLSEKNTTLTKPGIFSIEVCFTVAA